jgi:hypothetical protein
MIPEAKIAKGKSVSSLKLLRNKASAPTAKLETKKPMKAPNRISRNTLFDSASSALNILRRSFFNGSFGYNLLNVRYLFNN